MSGGADWKDMWMGVQRNDLALVKYYIQMGIDINYQHPEIMTTLLIESIRCGHLEITKLLLENGATPDKKEDFGNDTPISVATANQNKEAIKILSEYIKIIPSEKPKKSKQDNFFLRIWKKILGI